MNTIRMDPTAFDSTFDAVIAGFVPNAPTSPDCSYDYNGDGTATLRTFSNHQSGVSAAKASLDATAPVAPLKWSPGLYLAAKNHTTDMANQPTVTYEGTDGTTPTSRAGKYGSGIVYESNIIGDNDEMFVVMQALIGDSDAGVSRAKMMKDTFTQVGVA